MVVSDWKNPYRTATTAGISATRTAYLDFATASPARQRPNPTVEITQPAAIVPIEGVVWIAEPAIAPAAMTKRPKIPTIYRPTLAIKFIGVW